MNLPLWLEIAAMSLSSFFGAVVTANRKAPALGILLGGIIVGLGGGIVRDIMLNVMPVSVSQPAILPCAAFAALLGGLLSRSLEQSRPALVSLQALVAGLLVVIGAGKAIAFQVPPLSVILLALVTASAGGAMLDALTGQRAALLSQGHWHVTALVSGAAFILVVHHLSPGSVWLAQIGAVVLVVFLRIISFERSWACPVLPGVARDKDL